MSLKGDLLEACASCEPRNFLQIDTWPAGLIDWACGAVAMDAAGRSLTAMHASHLMLGSNMRVLIDPQLTPAEAVASAEMLLQWLKTFEARANPAENKLSLLELTTH